MLTIVGLCAVTLLALPVRAQDDCQSLLDFDSELLDQLAPLSEWHTQGYCGQGVAVGVITTEFPEREAIADLINADMFSLHPQQETRWVSTSSSSRATELVKTLHAIAPRASIYFYQLQSVNDFITATTWMEANDVRIIANLIAHPAFAESELDDINAFMSSAADKGILWLNSAGNYGSSYYESQVDWSKWDREGWHYFSDSASGLLPIRAIDSEKEVRAYVMWSDLTAEMMLSAFVDADNLTPLDLEPATYDVNPTQPAGRLDLGLLEPEQPVYLALIDTNHFRSNAETNQFQIYLVNAIIEGISLSGNSIPKPNDNPDVLTIGAIDAGDTNRTASRAAALGKPEIRTFGRSFLSGSDATGTAFSTLIVAGVAATYWSQDTDQTVDQIREQLLSDDDGVLAVAHIGENSLPWTTIISGIGLGVLFIIVILWTLWRKDRQYAIEALRQTEFRVEFARDCQSLTVLFELPLRRNGYPYLLRYFKSLRLDIRFDPRLTKKPAFDSWLANINISRATSHSSEVATARFKSSREAGTVTEDRLIKEINLSEEEAIVALDLNYQYHIQLPVQLSFSELQWDTNTGCPEKVQLHLTISHNRDILFSDALVDFRESTTATVTALTDDNTNDSSTKPRAVFVSYSQKNRTFVTRLVEHLREESACEFWLDFERIPPGARFWDQEIQASLDTCDRMLLVISPASMSSDEVAREWNYFLLKKKPILVLVYEEPDIIHYRLSPSQMIFWDAHKTNEMRAQIIRGLECY